MLGRCSVGQVWEKKPDNWPKVNKGPEEVPYINDLPASLLSSSSLGGMLHPFSWCEHLCLASVLPKQTVSLCALPLVVVLCLSGSIDMKLDKLQEMVRDRKAWPAAVHVVSKSQT